MKKTHVTLLLVAVAVVVAVFLYFGRGAGSQSIALSPKALEEGAALLEEGVPEEGGPELAVVEAIDAKRQQ